MQDKIGGKKWSKVAALRVEYFAEKQMKSAISFYFHKKRAKILNFYGHLVQN